MLAYVSEMLLSIISKHYNTGLTRRCSKGRNTHLPGRVTFFTMALKGEGTSTLRTQPPHTPTVIAAIPQYFTPALPPRHAHTPRQCTGPPQRHTSAGEGEEKSPWISADRLALHRGEFVYGKGWRSVATLLGPDNLTRLSYSEHWIYWFSGLKLF